jgi:hypothetical protein
MDAAYMPETTTARQGVFDKGQRMMLIHGDESW